MAEIIAAIIFIVSLCGIAAILFRKIPALDQLPVIEEQEQEQGQGRAEASAFKKFLASAKNFYSGIKNKFGSLLENLLENIKRPQLKRKSPKQNRSIEQGGEQKKDSYWEELKKFRKKKIRRRRKRNLPR